MKIYTRKGDDGKTGLLGSSSRVSKSSVRVSAYGEIDELNSVLGLVGAENQNADLDKILKEIQQDLFSIGSELARLPKELGPGSHDYSRITTADVKRLEHYVDKTEETLVPINKFILPGGTKVASLLHLARATCRRAERGVVALTESNTINPVAQTYLNRLSDLLFVLARDANSKAGKRERQWNP